jgi:hypothetical protein
VFACYPKLSEAEIKQLVIADKWQAALQAAIEADIERVTQQLASRVQALTERYAEPLPQIVDESSRPLQQGGRPPAKDGTGMVMEGYKQTESWIEIPQGIGV